MTKPELDAIARRLFPLLPHPNRRSYEYVEGTAVADSTEPWWTPGRMCPNHELLFTDICDACQSPSWEIPHEIPPPDPMDWEVFGHLLSLVDGVEFGCDQESKRWTCRIWQRFVTRPNEYTPQEDAADPRQALFLAVARMKGVAE